MSPSEIASLAPGKVLAESSGGTGVDASDAPPSVILKGDAALPGSPPILPELPLHGLRLSNPAMMVQPSPHSFGNTVTEFDLNGGDEVSDQLRLGQFVYQGMLRHGAGLRINAAGKINTLGAAPGTLTIRWRITQLDNIGTPVGPFDVIAASVVVTLPTGLGDSPWRCNMLASWSEQDPSLTALTGNGAFEIASGLADGLPLNFWQLRGELEVPTVNSYLMDIFAQFSVASPANILYMEQYTMEFL
jgi:hypothetical protein